MFYDTRAVHDYFAKQFFIPLQVGVSLLSAKKCCYCDHNILSRTKIILEERWAINIMFMWRKQKGRMV